MTARRRAPEDLDPSGICHSIKKLTHPVYFCLFVCFSFFFFFGLDSQSTHNNQSTDRVEWLK
jgi:hypothetical protein